MSRWYKRCGADFIHGTMMLNLEEKGAYSLCLDLIYDRGGPIPDDTRWLAGVCGVSLRKWSTIRAKLISLGKLVAVGGFLTSTEFDAWQITEGRAALSQATRELVAAASNGRCTYCQTESGPFEVDHVYPVALGGTDDLANLTIACRPCNRSKGAKPLSEWLQ